MRSRLIIVDQVSLIYINSSVQGHSINHPFRSVKTRQDRHQSFLLAIQAKINYHEWQCCSVKRLSSE